MASLEIALCGNRLRRAGRSGRRAKVKFCTGEQDRAQAMVRRFFGRRLDRGQLAALVGAPEHAEVEVGVYQGGLHLEFSDPPRYRYRGVSRVAPRPGRPVLIIDALHIHRPALRGQGLGLTIFSRQLATADRLHILRIETYAGRRNDENGYYTWPRYGFAGRLPRWLQARLSPALAGAVDVLDLMESAAGRAWWRRRGAAMHLVFDASYNSRCQQVFARYGVEKGVS